MWRGQAVIESPPDDTLVSCVKDLTPGRVLELGCGSGANAVWLAEQGWTVEAIDFSEEAVNVGRQLAAKRGVAVNFSVGDATAFKPENQFDLIISLHSVLSRGQGHDAGNGLRVSCTWRSAAVRQPRQVQSSTRLVRR